MEKTKSSTNPKIHLGAASSALLVSLALLFYSHTTQSAPYHGTPHSFVQPDGSTITLRLFGDEYYLRAETLDGYTVMRDEQTGWISYAVYDEAEEALISTGIPFENSTKAYVDLPWMVGEKHQRLPLDLLVDNVNDNHERLFPGSKHTVGIQYVDGVPTAAPPSELVPAPTGTVGGEIISLTVIVDFPDAPAPLPLSAYEAYFNDVNWNQDGNAMSIRRYYREVSFGKVDLKNIVRGIYRAKKTFAEYDKMSYAAGAREILNDVLGRLNNEGFDFSQLTTVGGKIQALNFMFTGHPKAWAQGMWFHQGWISYSADGVTTGKYACGSANAPLEIFTAIHENGHMVGNWPDTYNYAGGTEPIGNFCIMGGWGKFPPPPNPAFRTMAGWSNVIDITGREGVWQSTANDNTIYKYLKSGSSTEYYLFEARKKDSWLHKNIPDEGLTIWHVDTNGDQQNLNHLMVELMHGDNDWKDKEDACFHAGGAAAFNDRTIPNAKWWSGADSGLDIHNISAAGTTMSFTTGSGGNNDQCPSDPNKTEPGQCGCGTADTDKDNDGTPDCKDNCPTDPNKTQVGECGCGQAEGTCGGACVDKNTNCAQWASVGECDKNPGYMLPNCCASCEGTGTGTSECTEVDENAKKTLSCPSGEVIERIDFASYGVPKGSCDTGFSVDSCHATSSRSKVEASCLNKQSCEVSAYNSVFGDPCPGTHKKLAVEFTCSGGEDDNCPNDPNKTEPGECGCGVPEGSCSSGGSMCDNVAEGGTVTLSCPAGETINKIGFASYGLPQGSCDTGFATGTCHSSKSLSKVEASCLNRQSCNVGANNTNFGDPCPGTRKSLAVMYGCTGGSNDRCPADPNKTEPGICGCGVPDGTCDGDELYEAEDFTAKDGANLVSNHGGFSGTGFMDYGGNGTWIEWDDVYVSQPGKYTMIFRYAVGSSTHRQSEAIINGASQGNIGFASTGTWVSWKTDAIVVTLRKGDNKIRIRANTNNGGPNLDKMTIAFGNNAPDSRSAQSEQFDDTGYESLNCTVSRSVGMRKGSWLMAILRLLFSI